MPQPPATDVQASTIQIPIVVLWGTPILLLAIVGLVVFFTARRGKRPPLR